MSTLALSGVRDLSARFSGLLVDLWGVVHDGEQVFPGVVDALAKLHAASVRVVFVSNSSREGDDLGEDLVKMGIARDYFVAVVSSGDVTFAALREQDPRLFAGLPTRPRILHLGRKAVVPWLDQLGFEEVTDPEQAELIVATGMVRDRAELARKQAELAPLAAREVPLVCTNPDRIVRSSVGMLLAPGAMAHAYAEVGGCVHFYGKPHPPIYRAALARLGVDAEHVAGVGDTLETDVRGANQAGIASVLVTASGVHADQLDQLEQLYEEHASRPSFTLERLTW